EDGSWEGEVLTAAGTYDRAYPPVVILGEGSRADPAAAGGDAARDLGCGPRFIVDRVESVSERLPQPSSAVRCHRPFSPVCTWWSGECLGASGVSRPRGAISTLGL